MRRHDINHFSLFKRGNSKTWYAYYYDENNQRHFFSTHQKTKAAALKYCLELKNEKGFNTQRTCIPTFKEYASKFFKDATCPVLKDHADAGKFYAAVDKAKNRSTVRKKLIPVFGKYRLDEISTNVAKDGLIKIREKHKLGPKTTNNVRAILVQIMNYAIEEGYIMVNPVKKVKTWQEPHNPREAWTRDEIVKLFSDREAWKCDRSYYACLLAALTGMRFGEVRALRWDHIKDGWIYIDCAIAEKDGLKSTKSGKARRVPCPPIVNLIPRESETWVFSCDTINYCSRNALINPLLKRCEALKINKTFHGFRHFFNSQLIAAEISSEVIRGMIGHESQTMSEHYMHLETMQSTKVQALQSAILPLAVAE